MQKFLIYFLTLYLFPQGALAQADPYLEPANQVNVIFDGRMHQPGTREMVVFVGRVMETVLAYSAVGGPTRYRTSRFSAGTDSFHQMSLREAVEFDLAQLEIAGVLSYELNGPQQVADVLGLLPGGVTRTIGDGLRYTVGNWDVAGSPPLSSDLPYSFENFGEMTLFLVNHPEIGSLVQERSLRLMNLNLLEDNSGEPQVQEARALRRELLEARNAEDRFKFVTEKLDLLSEGISQLQAMEKNRPGILLESAEQVRRTIRRDVMSSAMLARNVFILLGDEKAAQQMAHVAELADSMLKLLVEDETVATMGAVAYVNVYLAAAVAITAIVSSGQKADQGRAVMIKLQEILNLLHQTRREMHARLNVVDSKLNFLIERLDLGLSDLQADSTRIEAKLIELKLTVDEYFQSSTEQLNALYDRYHRDEISLCLNNQFKLSTPIDGREFDRCLLLIHNNIQLYSRYEYDSLATSSDIAQAEYTSLLFPYASSLGSLVRTLRLEFGHELPHEREVYNPYVWNRNTRNLIELYQLHPELTVNAANGPIQATLQYGGQIESLFESLALTRDSNSARLVINKEIFKRILERYQNSVSLALDWVEGQLAANPYNYHVGKSSQQAFIGGVTDPIENESMPYCSGETLFGVAEYNWLDSKARGIRYHTPEINPTLKNFMRNPPPHAFPIWRSAYLDLPDELLWIERITGRNVSVCIRQFFFPNITHTDSETVVRILIRMEAQIDGQMLAYTEFAHTVSHFPTIMLEGREGTSLPAMYEQFWNGVDLPPSQLTRGVRIKFDGIADYQFSDLARWSRVAGGLPIANDMLEPFIIPLRAEMIGVVLNHTDYQPYRQEVAKLRNILLMLITLGIADSVPERGLLEQLLYSGARSTGLRDLDTMVADLAEVRQSSTRVKEQIGEAGAQFLNILEAIDRSGKDIRPINYSIRETLNDLRRLLRPELQPPEQ
jgi:hypothetical protein